MYNRTKATKTTLKVNESSEGETIEKKVRRITEQKEPIVDGAPPIFTERSEGIPPDTNIRTDRWELAVDAMDVVAQQKVAKRKKPAKKTDKAEKANEGGNTGNDGGSAQSDAPTSDKK